MVSTLAETVRGLAPRLAEREAADPERYPAENIADLVAAGIIRAPFPVSAGGNGSSLIDAVDAIESIAAASPSTALLAAMPLGLAGAYSVRSDVVPAEHRQVWSDQIDHMAAEYREGVLYAACNSEKGAGGSLEATKTIARRRNGTFELTGEKILASFGRHAGMFFSTAKVNPAEMPGGGVVEFFFVRPTAPGVEILNDWDGFGMRSTESQTVRYNAAPAEGILGFPNFIEIVQPLSYWFALFTAIKAAQVRKNKRVIELLSKSDLPAPASKPAPPAASSEGSSKKRQRMRPRGDFPGRVALRANSGSENLP